jgi:hypothetical protein
VVPKNIKHCLDDAQTNEKIIKPIKINVNLDFIIFFSFKMGVLNETRCKLEKFVKLPKNFA